MDYQFLNTLNSKKAFIVITLILLFVLNYLPDSFFETEDIKPEVLVEEIVIENREKNKIILYPQAVEAKPVAEPPMIINLPAVKPPETGFNFNSFKKISLIPKCSCQSYLTVTQYDDIKDPSGSLYEFKHNYFHFMKIDKPELIPEKVAYISTTTPDHIKSIHINPKFTCNLDKVLNSGSGQKVIGYSLHGISFNETSFLERLIDNVKNVFPGWSVRFYHNNDFNQSLICDLECRYKEVSFCDITQIPFKSDETIDLFSKYVTHGIFDENNKVINDMSYVVGGMWKWFPISDDFVEYFISRDINTTLIQRDKDAVDDWINSKKSFHIIRDSPLHNSTILGDLWGHTSVVDRYLGQFMYKKFVDQDVQKRYTEMLGRNLSMSEIESISLKEIAWNFAEKNSKIHDSYTCQSLGGEPFPSKRPTNINCFVGCKNKCCDENQNQTAIVSPVCPESCRPKDHNDWQYC